MDPKLLDELADIIVLPKPEALAQLQEKKHQGKLSSGDVELLITEFLSPARTETDGHKVALHTQLARARFADDDVICCQGNGTPPKRYSWSVADRRSEPIRRGSPEWVAARRPLAGGSLARKSLLVTCLDDSDEDEEAAATAAAQTNWGRVERGRTEGQRCDARLRCARGQPSSLRSSWSVERDEDTAMVASKGTVETEDERVDGPLEKTEKAQDEVEDPVDRVEETIDKIEEPVERVQKPVDVLKEPRTIVADKLDRRHNSSDREEEDREVPGSLCTTTLRRWREAIMWRC